MTDAPTLAARTNGTDPCQDRQVGGLDIPDHISCVLRLVRLLIGFGKELADTLRKRGTADNLPWYKVHFGSVDLPLILSRITRGLALAAALEERLERRLAHPPAPRASTRAPAVRRPRIAPSEGPDIGEFGGNVVRMPTAAEIAAMVRRRPIGAVLADICRDLGLVPSDPLWLELDMAIMNNGGNMTALTLDTHVRMFSSSGPGAADLVFRSVPPSRVRPLAVASGAGPP